jgi:hypothetical protein
MQEASGLAQRPSLQPSTSGRTTPPPLRSRASGRGLLAMLPRSPNNLKVLSVDDSQHLTTLAVERPDPTLPPIAPIPVAHSKSRLSAGGAPSAAAIAGDAACAVQRVPRASAPGALSEGLHSKASGGGAAISPTLSVPADLSPGAGAGGRRSAGDVAPEASADVPADVGAGPDAEAPSSSSPAEGAPANEDGAAAEAMADDAHESAGPADAPRADRRARRSSWVAARAALALSQLRERAALQRQAGAGRMRLPEYAPAAAPPRCFMVRGPPAAARPPLAPRPAMGSPVHGASEVGSDAAAWPGAQSGATCSYPQTPTWSEWEAAQPAGVQQPGAPAAGEPSMPSWAQPIFADDPATSVTPAAARGMLGKAAAERAFAALHPGYEHATAPQPPPLARTTSMDAVRGAVRPQHARAARASDGVDAASVCAVAAGRAAPARRSTTDGEGERGTLWSLYPKAARTASLKAGTLRDGAATALPERLEPPPRARAQAWGGVGAGVAGSCVLEGDEEGEEEEERASGARGTAAPPSAAGLDAQVAAAQALAQAAAALAQVAGYMAAPRAGGLAASAGSTPRKAGLIAPPSVHEWALLHASIAPPPLLGATQPRLATRLMAASPVGPGAWPAYAYGAHSSYSGASFASHGGPGAQSGPWQRDAACSVASGVPPPLAQEASAASAPCFGGAAPSGWQQAATGMGSARPWQLKLMDSGYLGHSEIAAP